MSGFKNNLLIFFLCKVVSWKLYGLQTQKNTPDDQGKQMWEAVRNRAN